MDDRALMRQALTAREAAYAPYSRFAVGAALLCVDGSVYLGCNIENAAYSPSLCAERVAFAKAVSEGKRSFRAIAIAGGPAGSPPNAACAPCGVCRQTMAEFCASEDLRIVLGSSPEDVQAYTLRDLLPLAFTGDIVIMQ